jgi:hypothetical protein
LHFVQIDSKGLKEVVTQVERDDWESIVEKLKKAGWIGAILLILVTMLWNGLAFADQQQKQDEVITENLLQKAGFQKWAINQNTPQREALLSALPKRTIVIYRRDGQTLHAYGDKDTRTLYVGDEVAFQRYLSFAQGRKVCQVREGGESPAFWSCMDEYRQGDGGQPGK